MKFHCVSFFVERAAASIGRAAATVK